MTLFLKNLNVLVFELQLDDAAPVKQALDFLSNISLFLSSFGAAIWT